MKKRGVEGKPGSRRKERRGEEEEKLSALAKCGQCPVPSLVLSGGRAGKKCSRTLAPSNDQELCLFWDSVAHPK